MKLLLNLFIVLQGHSEGSLDPSVRLGGRRELFPSHTSTLSLTARILQHTLEAIEQGVTAVVDSDSDDFFLIVLTDANFERYGISKEDLTKAMNSNAKVKTCAETPSILLKLQIRLTPVSTHPKLPHRHRRRRRSRVAPLGASWQGSSRQEHERHRHDFEDHSE